MAGGEDCCWIGALALIREGEQMEGHLLLNPTTTTKLNNLKCQCYIHTLLCKLDRIILVQTYRQDSRKRRNAKGINRELVQNMKLQHSGDHIIEAQTGLGTDGS